MPLLMWCDLPVLGFLRQGNRDTAVVPPWKEEESEHPPEGRAAADRCRTAANMRHQICAGRPWQKRQYPAQPILGGCISDGLAANIADVGISFHFMGRVLQKIG